jgi:transposase
LHRQVFRLSEQMRRDLLRRSSEADDPATALRFRMVARMGAGVSCRQTATEFGVVPATAVRARMRYIEHGWRGLLDGRRTNGKRKLSSKFLVALKKVLRSTPQTYGWKRSTWSRELLARQLARMGFPEVAESTLGRALAAVGARLGSPKPIVLCPWPRRQREQLLAQLNALAESATKDEPVFYEDEIDIHLNPRIGRDWMLRGTQRRVVTPGKNVKHYLAGALDARTNKLTWVDGTSKCSALFIKLVFRIMATHRKARRIHFILDNYSIHSSKRTQQALAQFGDRLVLHFLPPYTPDANKIERRWRDLHGNVTRNHQCKTMDALLANAFDYLKERNRRDCGRLFAWRNDSPSRAAI